MSRNIDLTQTLSDEDRAYLVSRSRLRDIAKADALDHSSLPDDSITASTHRSPAAQPAAVGDQNPSGGASQPDNPLASPATEHTVAATTEEDEEADNYDDEEAWSYAEIRDEVKEREADDKPALNSSRDDLVAWLRKYDQDVADSDES